MNSGLGEESEDFAACFSVPTLGAAYADRVFWPRVTMSPADASFSRIASTKDFLRERQRDFLREGQFRLSERRKTTHGVPSLPGQVGRVWRLGTPYLDGRTRLYPDGRTRAMMTTLHPRCGSFPPLKN